VVKINEGRQIAPEKLEHWHAAAEYSSESEYSVVFNGKYSVLSESENSFLPSADSKAVCRGLRKHFLTHPPSPPDIIESQL
jgi:hypothetical protein